jgi:hypothetical protein
MNWFGFGGTQTLAFNRDQLKSVLEEFVAWFQSAECRNKLAELAPNETAMENFIEITQKEIFAKHSVDPQLGYSQMRLIPQHYKNDKEILDLLMFVGTKEELVIKEALMSKQSQGAPSREQEFTSQLINLQLPQVQAQMASARVDPNQQLQMQQVFQAMVRFYSEFKIITNNVDNATSSRKKTRINATNDARAYSRTKSNAGATTKITTR